MIYHKLGTTVYSLEPKEWYFFMNADGHLFLFSSNDSSCIIMLWKKRGKYIFIIYI